MAGLGGISVDTVEDVKFFVVELAKDYMIRTFDFDNSGNINSINFSKENSNYTAKMQNGLISLFDRDTNTPIAEFNKKTGKTSWYLNNVCESFNVPQVDTDLAMHHALQCIGRDYSKPLYDVLTIGIPNFASNFYNFCKK